MHFKDRERAGIQLAELLTDEQGPQTVVYALPRGGVVLGAVIARRVHAPLELVFTRKIGHPENPELAIAAVAEDGHIIKNEALTRSVDARWFEREIASQQQEIRRRRERYLGSKQSLSARGKTCIIVDDGLATGLSMKAAVGFLRRQGAKKIIVAVPVAPADVAGDIADSVEKFVILHAPAAFVGAIGAYYERFSQVSDEEVIALLNA